MKTKIIFINLLLFLITCPTKAQEWQFVGLDSMVIKQLYVSGDTIWAGTDTRINPNMIAGLYKSTDGGTTWNQLDITLGDGSSVFFYKNSKNNSFYLVKGASEWSIAGICYKSSDQGESWEIVQQLESVLVGEISMSDFNQSEIYAKESHYITAGWYATVYRSLDGGKNWQEITSSFPMSSHGRSMAFNLSSMDSNKLYAAVDDRMGSQYFFISINKGNSWDYISPPPAVEQELITDPTIPNRIFMFPGFYLTEDDGYTWMLADSCFTSVYLYLSFYVDPFDKTNFYCLRKDGLYKTKNDPICWQLIEGSNNLPLNIGSYGFIYEDIGQLRNVFIDTLTNEIYVGTAKGIYKKTLITEVGEKTNNLPTEFILEQNYPNPFNPITTISYQIPENCFVSLKVYDVLGNEIITLVAGEKLRGKYHVEFNGNGRPSSVYFYVLLANSETGKIIK